MKLSETYPELDVNGMIRVLFKTDIKATVEDLNGQLIIPLGIYRWKDGSYHNMSESEAK